MISPELGRNNNNQLANLVEQNERSLVKSTVKLSVRRHCWAKMIVIICEWHVVKHVWIFSEADSLSKSR